MAMTTMSSTKVNAVRLKWVAEFMMPLVLAMQKKPPGMRKMIPHQNGQGPGNCAGSTKSFAKQLLVCVWGLGLLGFSGCSSERPAGEAEAKLSVAQLREKLQSNKVSDRLGAALGLRNRGSQASEAVPDLIKVMRSDNDAGVRQSAAQALGETRSAEAVPALMDILAKETDAALRRQAAAALGKIGASAQKALSLLQQMSNTGPPIVRPAAREAIELIRSSAGPSQKK